VYGKLVVRVPDVTSTLNPPLASITTPAVGVVGTTTLNGRPLGSEFPTRRPGEGIFK
jgi:hypothetical protein